MSTLITTHFVFPRAQNTEVCGTDNFKTVNLRKIYRNKFWFKLLNRKYIFYFSGFRFLVIFSKKALFFCFFKLSVSIKNEKIFRSV